MSISKQELQDLRRRHADILDGKETHGEGRVTGYPNKLIGLGLWENPPAWQDRAPFYYARGHVMGAGKEAFAELQLWGHERRRTAPRRYLGESVKLTHLESLVAEWVSLSDRFGATFQGVAEGLPRFSAERKEEIAPGRWRVAVSSEEARVLAADRWLSDVLSISACSSTAKVDVRVSFEPIDAAAADLFALDHVAQAVEQRGAPHSPVTFAEHVRRAAERYPVAQPARLTRARVDERLWSLKRFVAVYAYREQEDFAYV